MHINEFIAGNARKALICLVASLLSITFCALEASAAAKPKSRQPIYVDLVDQTGPQFGPSVGGLDERRRGPIFADAMRAAAKAGELPPVTFVNDDLSLIAGVSNKAEKAKVPAGAEVARVFITRWAKTRTTDAFNTDINCRVFVEIFQDGQQVAKLGPFFGAAPSKLYINPDYPQDLADFGSAARAAVNQMAKELVKR